MNESPDYLREVIQGITTNDPLHINLQYGFGENPNQLFKEFPVEQLGDLSKLRSITLKNHDIRKLPSSFGRLVKLLYLDLSNMPLESLAENIGNLQALKSLQASNLSEPDMEEYFSKIFEGPTHPSKFDSLAGLTELPKSFAQLKGLESLKLDGNRFQIFPKEILELTNLTYLDLSMNAIQEIPEEIAQLDQLSYLKLSRNNFRHLPEGISSLKKLKRLRLDGLILEDLPAGIGGLESLEMLEICMGELHAFPPEIQKLKNLQDFYLGGTKIDETDVNALRVFLPHCRLHTDFDLDIDLD